MLTALIRGLVLGFPNAGVPGPFQAYLLSQTMRHGWKRTLPVALAPLISDGPIIALVLFVLLQLSKQTLGYIQIAGGIFILYLAFGAYKTISAAQENRPAPQNTRGGLRSVSKGAFMNALNPAPYIFWGTVGGPILLNGWRESPHIGIAFLVGFYGTLITAFAVLIWVFGTVGGLHPRARKILSSISAIALTLFGLAQLLLGISSVWNS